MMLVVLTSKLKDRSLGGSVHLWVLASVISRMSYNNRVSQVWPTARVQRNANATECQIAKKVQKRLESAKQWKYSLCLTRQVVAVKMKKRIWCVCSSGDDQIVKHRMIQLSRQFVVSQLFCFQAFTQLGREMAWPEQLSSIEVSKCSFSLKNGHMKLCWSVEGFFYFEWKLAEYWQP